MSVATVNYTHEQSIHVNYVIKSFWSKLNEDIMLYRQYPDQLKFLNTNVSWKKAAFYDKLMYICKPLTECL